ncbi:MAG: hypothetical protein ACOYJG_06625 [Prevotella sp.]|jgi:hypothetical protein
MTKRQIVYILVGLFVLGCVVYGVSNFNRIAYPKKEQPKLITTKMKGDKTVYGLACEGYNDTVLILLPPDNSDPVTYNILDATRNGKIRGKVSIGDRIALVLDPNDKHKATLVIDMEELEGIWCYIVMPKLKDFDHMSNREQARKLAAMPDSIKQTYYIPREYGFWIKSNWSAQSVGYVNEQSSVADESPVVYPALGYFTAWHIWNGKFVMVSGTPYIDKDGKQGVKDLWNDTCDIDYLDEDSLVLTDVYGSRSYYKKSDINEVNKKARQIAEQLSKKALEETK